MVTRELSESAARGQQIPINDTHENTSMNWLRQRHTCINITLKRVTFLYRGKDVIHV